MGLINIYNYSLFLALKWMLVFCWYQLRWFRICLIDLNRQLLLAPLLLVYYYSLYVINELLMKIVIENLRHWCLFCSFFEVICTKMADSANLYRFLVYLLRCILQIKQFLWSVFFVSNGRSNVIKRNYIH